MEIMCIKLGKSENRINTLYSQETIQVPNFGSLSIAKSPFFVLTTKL